MTNLEVRFCPECGHMVGNCPTACSHHERPKDAQTVVATVVDSFAEQGIPLAGRFRGIIGKHAKDLLESGFDFETVVVASVIAVRRGAPQNLTFIATDLVTARAGQRMTRSEYERALQDEMEVRTREGR